MSSLRLILVLTFIIIQAIGATGITPTNETIVFPTAQSWFSKKSVRAQYFSTKYMSTTRFDLTTASSTFVKIPGLRVAVNHTVPILYKIWFSTGCYMTQPFGSSFLHFMIDDSVLIGNILLPNTADRYRYAPTLGTNLLEVDAHGASFVRANDNTAGTYYTYSKFEIVYLPAGLHEIEVVVRTDNPSLFVHTGILTVELTQYESDANIGLNFPSKF